MFASYVQFFRPFFAAVEQAIDHEMHASAKCAFSGKMFSIYSPRIRKLIVTVTWASDGFVWRINILRSILIFTPYQADTDSYLGIIGTSSAMLQPINNVFIVKKAIWADWKFTYTQWYVNTMHIWWKKIGPYLGQRKECLPCLNVDCPKVCVTELTENFNPNTDIDNVFKFYIFVFPKRH